ncbi:hypothetical protein C7974DRAFT_312278 [Boeremia exigua]|uniref:uncharacterized protein n=1 Tax=Boeremia exigua TaxID=749465 RepID=UPI001E8E790B|nr:uncharacterized protein C7974DRAFT_312278 [Boeremia exigua]KAH6625416.1 hypothetical protein C7974DRAFT_312278 [Boeremia exigua]
MVSKLLLITLAIAYVEARFGQEQIPIPAIGAVQGGAPGAAGTISGAAISDLLGAANSCAKLQRADQVVSELGGGADAIAAAIGLVTAEKNTNPFANGNVQNVCGDPSLPATAELRGITPLIDPDVDAGGAAAALSKSSAASPLNADGLSVFDLMSAAGLGDLVVSQAAAGGAAAGAAGAGNAGAGNAGAGNAGAGNAGAGNAGGKAGGNAGGNAAGGNAAGGNAAGGNAAGGNAAGGNAAGGNAAGGNAAGGNAAAGNGAACNAGNAAAGNGTAAAGGNQNAGNGNAGNNNAGNNNAGNSNAGNNKGNAGNGNAGNQNAGNGNAGNNNAGNGNAGNGNAGNGNAGNGNANQDAGNNAGNNANQGAANNNNNNNNNNNQGANNNNANAGAGAGAGAGAANGAAAGGAADFGQCTPTIDLAGGRGNRPADELTFQITDPLARGGQQEALNPNIITSALCNQLTNVCGANAAAIAKCEDAKAQVAAAGTRDQSTADLFNSAIGFGGAAKRSVSRSVSRSMRRGLRL